jgi:hypothetical protein
VGIARPGLLHNCFPADPNGRPWHPAAQSIISAKPLRICVQIEIVSLQP